MNISACARLGILGTTILTTGCVGFTGLASAASISNTGPGSFNAIYDNNTVGGYGQYDTMSHSGSTEQYLPVAGNSSGAYESGINDMMSTQYPSWSSMNPVQWQQNGQTFSSWWGRMNQIVEQYSPNHWSQNQIATNSSWYPSGADWQNNWSNWNPTDWQSNGQSCETWRSMIMRYMTSNYNTWMENWGGSQSSGYSRGHLTTSPVSNYMASAYSGRENKTQHASYGLGKGKVYGQSGARSHYNAPVAYHQNQGTYGTGRNTYPSNSGSYEASTAAPDYYPQVNRRNATNAQTTTVVGVTNMNDQTAQTGNAVSAFNTGAGNVSTGNALNRNATYTAVNVTNPVSAYVSGSGSYGNGNDRITTTGPNSTNYIMTSNTSRINEITTNIVRSINSNMQDARSGNATSIANTVGGNVTSGSAMNDASVATSVGVN